MERLHQLRAEHLRQQLGARLPVAVLARQRAAEAQHQIGGVIKKCSKGGDAFSGLQVERDACVDTALTEVTIERAVVVVILLEQASQAAQVIAEPRRWHG